MGKASAISKETRESYKAAVDLVERAIVAEDKDKAKLLFAQALSLAISCVHNEESSAEFNYLAGYIHYKTPTKTEATWRQAETFFKQALALSPSHQFARYYLGCLYFDRKRYVESHSELNLLHEYVFTGIDQKWRVAKANELLLCCELYLNRNSTPLNQFDRLFEKYSAIEDPSLAPVPSELSECLQFLLKERGPDDSGLASICRVYLKIVGYLGLVEFVKEKWPLLHAFVVGKDYGIIH